MSKRVNGQARGKYMLVFSLVAVGLVKGCPHKRVALDYGKRSNINRLNGWLLMPMAALPWCGLEKSALSRKRDK